MKASSEFRDSRLTWGWRSCQEPDLTETIYMGNCGNQDIGGVLLIIMFGHEGITGDWLGQTMMCGQPPLGHHKGFSLFPPESWRKAFQKVFSLSGGVEGGSGARLDQIFWQQAGNRLTVSWLRGSWETGAVKGQAGGGGGLDWRSGWWGMGIEHSMCVACGCWGKGGDRVSELDRCWVLLAEPEQGKDAGLGRMCSFR